MKIGTLLSLSALLSLLFGLTFTFVPATALANYGFTDVTPGHLYATKWFGIALMAFAALNWSARRAPDSEARRAIVLGNLVQAVCGLVLALQGVLQGTVNQFGWVSVVIYAVLGLGFMRAQLAPATDGARAPA